MKFKDLKDYRFKYDLHVHTAPVSSCAELDVETTVSHYKKLGFSGIVVTNHFSRDVFGNNKSKAEWLQYYLNDFREAESYGRKCGLDVLLGLEIRFPENSNDYLVFGIDENDVSDAYDYLDSDYISFYRDFKNDKNVIVQAHPFRKSAILQDLKFLDGIEVFNMHPSHNSVVGKAAKLANENPGLIITGGTDFHHEGHQGMCGIRSKTELSDSFELSACLKTRDYLFDIWGNIIVPEALL